VAEHPAGHVEPWADGASLPYTTYDRFPEVDQGAIVDNKRLGRTLAIAAEIQSLRGAFPDAPGRTAPSEGGAAERQAAAANRLDLEGAIQLVPQNGLAASASSPTPARSRQRT